MTALHPNEAIWTFTVPASTDAEVLEEVTYAAAQVDSTVQVLEVLSWRITHTDPQDGPMVYAEVKVR